MPTQSFPFPNSAMFSVKTMACCRTAPHITSRHRSPNWSFFCYILCRHYHSDHYGGLNGSWSYGNIICSRCSDSDSDSEKYSMPSPFSLLSTLILAVLPSLFPAIFTPLTFLPEVHAFKDFYHYRVLFSASAETCYPDPDPASYRNELSRLDSASCSTFCFNFSTVAQCYLSDSFCVV
jgi:hypothetical protein